MALEILTLGTHSSIVEVAWSTGQLSPSWSSDGTMLAYAAGGRIYTVDGTGHAKRRLPFSAAATAPAIRPGSSQVAYLTSHGAQNTDLWVDDTRWAGNVIGKPAWNAAGTMLAVQRDDGVYVLTGPGTERKLGTAASPGAPVWHGDDVVYPAVDRIWKVSAVSTAPHAVPLTRRFPDIASPTFDDASGALLFTARGGVEVSTSSLESMLYLPGAGLGVAVEPPNDSGDVSLAYVGPREGCPGHLGLRVRTGAQLASDTGVSGTCDVVGTTRADVIEGSPREGDVILAGAGNDRIHANDGHTDRIDCGPGHDTVWADRSDRLAHCEIVHS
jgi:hypothetical protein